MKTRFLFLAFLFLIASCSESAKNTTNGENEESPIETTVESDGETEQAPINEVIDLDLSNVEKADYQELYESGALKIEGNFNESQERHGIWTSYYETGTKWSESHYINGLKSGHSITFFPNGKVRYMGEYKDDVKIGVWRFYDEDGTLVKEENFDE